MSKKTKVFIVFGIICLICFISIYIVWSKNKDVNYYKDIKGKIEPIAKVEWENTKKYGYEYDSIYSDIKNYDVSIVDDGYIIAYGNELVVKYDFDNNVVWENIPEELYRGMIGGFRYSYVDTFCKGKMLFLFGGDYENSYSNLKIYNTSDGEVINDVWQYNIGAPQYDMIDFEDSFITYSDDGFSHISLEGNSINEGYDNAYPNVYHETYNVAQKKVSIINVDDGYIVAGGVLEAKNKAGEKVSATKFTKYDIKGNMIWEVEENGYFKDITTTKWNKMDDNNNIISKENGILAVGPDSCIKLNLSGEKVWEDVSKNLSYYEADMEYYAFTGIEVDDGNIIVLSSDKEIKYSNVRDNNSSKMVMVKINSDGEISKYFSITEDYINNSSFRIKTNGKDFYTFSKDFGMIKYDLNFESISKIYLNSPDNTKYKFIESKDGYTIIYNSREDRKSYIHINRFDLDGNLTKQIDKECVSYTKVDEENTDIYAGFSYEYFWEAHHIENVLRLDRNGNIVQEDIKDHNFREQDGRIRISRGEFIYEAWGDHIVKLDGNENVLFEFYPQNGEYYGEIQDMIDDYDGIVVVTRDGFIGKLDFDGNLMWFSNREDYNNYLDYFRENYGEYYGLDESYTGVVRNKDGYLVCCSNGLVLKFDTEGNIVGENSEEVGKLGVGYRDIALVDDGFVCVSSLGSVVKYSYHFDYFILLEITVHHYLEDTINQIAPDERIIGQENEFYETSPITYPQLDERYELVQEKYPLNASGILDSNVMDVIYYYREKQYKITTEVSSIGGKISGQGSTNDNPYETVKHDANSVKDIIVIPDDGYEVSEILVNGEAIKFNANSDGTVMLNKFLLMSEDKHIVVNFEKKKTNVIVKYIDMNSNSEIYEQDIISGRIDDDYNTINQITNINEKYENKYEYVNATENTSGKMTKDQIQVIYYYKKKDANVKVLHVLEGTDVSSPETLDNVLYTTENMPGRVDDPYYTQSRLTEINRDSKIQYELVSDEVDNKTGTMELNTIYVVYEYRTIPSEVKVNHLELNTNKMLSGKETVYGVVGEDYSTQDRLDEINSKLENKYELVEIPINKIGVFTREEREITYYYQKKESSVEVNYIDIDTNESLSDRIEMNGRVDDEYITEDMIDKINENSSKYSLIKVDGNANGQYTVDKQIITYYYKRKPTVLRVKYIDLQTGEEIIEEISVKGYVGDRYETELKQIDGYEIVIEKIPSNKDGELLEEEVEIIYYYKKIQDDVNINNENNDNRNIFNLPNTSDINVFYNIGIFVICILVAIKIKKYCK